MSAVRPLGVGLLGLGTVGSGVARVLLSKQDALERRIGRPVQICKVLVRNLDKPRGVRLEAPLVTDARAVLDDPSVEVDRDLLVSHVDDHDSVDPSAGHICFFKQRFEPFLE